MINIGKSAYTNKKRTLTILDPFVGSGTSYLESLKYNDIQFFGGDICSISHLLVKINTKFFSLTSAELNDLSRFTLLYLKNLNNDKYDVIFKNKNVGIKDFIR